MVQLSTFLCFPPLFFSGVPLGPSDGRSGHALDFASEALRGERRVVLTAVRENKGAMAYASKARCRSWREIFGNPREAT